MDEPEVYPKASKTIGNGKVLPLNFNECWRSFSKGCTIKMFHEDLHLYWLAHGMIGQQLYRSHSLFTVWIKTSQAVVFERLIYLAWLLSSIR